jgi:hypothetical protein
LPLKERKLVGLAAVVGQKMGILSLPGDKGKFLSLGWLQEHLPKDGFQSFLKM